MLNEQLYPVFKTHISCRLSRKRSQIRDLRFIERIIDIYGSSYLFLKYFNGNNSINNIAIRVASAENQCLPKIKRDLNGLLTKLCKNNIVSISHFQNTYQDFKFLKYIASDIRSSVHFDITHLCNQNCAHCLVSKDNKTASFSDIQKIILQASSLGFTNLSFSGGEPTLHPRIWDILSMARDYGFYFTLFTNGISFTESKIMKLASFYPEQVRISLYSMNASVHDRITQSNGSYNKTLKTIISMVDNGIKVFVNCPVMNINYRGFRSVAKFCSKYHIGRNFDPVIQPARDLHTANRHLQLSYKQAKDVTSFQQNAVKLVVNVRRGVPVCNVGEDPCIDANLNLYPCPGLRIKLGNLRKQSFKSLLINNPIIIKASKLSLDSLFSCQTCAVRTGCYRCHGHAYQETGSIYGCSRIDKRQAKIRKELMLERRTL